jgi:hypothetical protein
MNCQRDIRSELSLYGPGWLILFPQQYFVTSVHPFQASFVDFTLAGV